jgi:para-nitrobenzyl esterase
MVWIYGGGFTGGSGGMAWYDGENLAAKGPVIVTLQLSPRVARVLRASGAGEGVGPQRVGNYGMMDAIAALQWVKRNISAFGGDPNNVTVAGESAGAIMVGALVGSPQAKGLFTRAIAESGGWMGLTMARMRVVGGGTGRRSQRRHDRRTARQASRPAHRPLGAGLVVDGYLIPEDTSSHVHERQAERRRRPHRIEQGRSELRHLPGAGSMPRAAVRR